MIVKLLTEHHLEFLSLKGGCTGSSESTHVRMPHCWKSHATACLILNQSEILVFIAHSQKSPINAHADRSSGDRAVNSDLSLHLHPFFMYGSTKGSVKSVHSHGLI